MSFMVSPGINVSELDLTAGVQTTALSVAAFAGPFQWGPALDVVNVGSEVQLAQTFGKPDANVYEYWFTAQSFLAYSNQLRVVRAIANNALNATTDDKALSGTIAGTNNTTTMTGTSTAFTTELVNGQTIVVNGVSYTVANVTNAISISVTPAISGGTFTGVTGTKYGALIKNANQWEDSFSTGVSGYGLGAAKWPSDLGNSLKVSVCPTANAFEDASLTGTITPNTSTTTLTGVGTAFLSELVAGDYIVLRDNTGKIVEKLQVASIASNTSLVLEAAPTVTATTYTANGAANTAAWSRRWEYWSLFDDAPGTSDFATNKGASSDEMHLVVVDEDGLFTGVNGTVLEKFSFASKASNAKDVSGNNNYYADILNRRSLYVWWLGHPGTDTASWGSVAASGTAFGGDALPYTASFVGGNDANEDITDGNIETAWDEFADVDQVDISLLVTGPVDPTTVGEYIVSNVCEVRKDCVAFLSPNKASVVGNPGGELDDVITDRGSLNTSYAVMDSGWKYQYDKYNDVYRWIPLNGDVAGLAARTDTTNDPWWSPAGFTRGNIKNVVKLAWNPKQLDRDDLYKIGVNPVVSFPGQGVLLYGDKTLLTRPSAFDRINVRRLFIALEKTIARYAKAQLFEFNDEFTRSAFRNAVEPFLRDVKARRGITDFLVVCDASNNTSEVIDSNRFVGDIYVKPTRAINFIQLNFVAVRSGVSFQEVVGTA